MIARDTGKTAMTRDEVRELIDGAGTVDPNNHFAEDTKRWPLWARIVVWSCWRNPTGNLRFVRPFGFRIQPEHVISIGTFDHPDELQTLKGFRWYYAAHGFYTGLWWRFPWFSVRIGWKIYPADIKGVTDYRSKGCGFALQFQGK